MSMPPIFMRHNHSIAFSALSLGEQPRWNHLVAFALIVAAVGFAHIPRTV
jgi:uncharacterized protein (DUF486 family)